MTKRPLQVYLDASDRALLERLARHLGVSRAEAVREAVRRCAIELTGHHDPLLALIGSIDGPSVPTDLSTRGDEYLYGDAEARRVAERRTPD